MAARCALLRRKLRAGTREVLVRSWKYPIMALARIAQTSSGPQKEIAAADG